jgi:drug/metabolite transporter (DMT)-like permease
MSAREFSMLLTLGAIWGASFMFIKVGSEGLQPFALVEMRLALAAVVLLAANAYRKGYFSALLTNWRALTVMGLLNCAVPYTLITWGEHYISSGLAAIYNASSPLWVALLLVMLPASSERLNGVRLVGLLCGLVGVSLVVSGNLSLASEDPLHLVGQGACLLAAISYAVAGLFGRRALVGVPSSVSATGQLVTGAIMLIPLAALQVPTKMPSGLSIGAVVALAVLGTALASMMYYWLLARVGATGALLVTYLLPGFALIWGALFLREQITLTAVLGLCLVLLGIAITSGSGPKLVAAVARFRGGRMSGDGTGGVPV